MSKVAPWPSMFTHALLRIIGEWTLVLQILEGGGGFWHSFWLDFIATTMSLSRSLGKRPMYYDTDAHDAIDPIQFVSTPSNTDLALTWASSWKNWNKTLGSQTCRVLLHQLQIDDQFMKLRSNSFRIFKRKALKLASLLKLYQTPYTRYPEPNIQ